MLYTTKYSAKTIKAYKIGYKVLAILFTVSVFTIWASYQYFHGTVYIAEVLENNIPPLTEPKEVIRYIEKKDAVPTWKLIQHLNGRLSKDTSTVIANEVNKAHEKFGLPKKLIIAIMRKESNLDPLAKSRSKEGKIIARGLMQIFAKWHPKKMEGINLEELYHIDINVNMGCQIFREYYDKSDGDLTETFHKYLSKRASKSDAKKYMDEILKWWATLEMYEYNKEANITFHQNQPLQFQTMSP
jgi:hypothetical protein